MRFRLSSLGCVHIFMTLNHIAEPELHRTDEDLNTKQSTYRVLLTAWAIATGSTWAHSHPETPGQRLAILYRASLAVKRSFLEFGQWASLLSPALVQMLPFWMFIHAH